MRLSRTGLIEVARLLNTDPDNIFCLSDPNGTDPKPQCPECRPLYDQAERLIRDAVIDDPPKPPPLWSYWPVWDFVALGGAAILLLWLGRLGG